MLNLENSFKLGLLWGKIVKLGHRVAHQYNNQQSVQGLLKSVRLLRLDSLRKKFSPLPFERCPESINQLTNSHRLNVSCWL